MNTAGAHELGYANAAIVAALLERLIARKVLSPTDIAGTLADAVESLNSLGRLASVPGAIRIVGDVKAQLAKHSVG
jgi:hypothetical protein